MASIYDLVTPFELRGIERRQGPDYCAKMMHLVPDAPVVDRIRYILDHCKGKRVLNLGSASGDLHNAVRAVATEAIGIDKKEPCDFVADLDSHNHPIPQNSFDIIVAGEILEHLANPGNLLRWLRSYACPLLITAPNAMSDVGYHWIQRSYEQVNTDHVAYYSWWTLTNLVKRYGFTPKEFAWYNGRQGTAEGLIVLTD